MQRDSSGPAERWLTRRKACSEEVAIFDAEWPNGAEISAANILRAVTLELNIDWFARRILTAPAERAYEETTASALIKQLEQALVSQRG